MKLKFESKYLANIVTVAVCVCLLILSQWHLSQAAEDAQTEADGGVVTEEPEYVTDQVPAEYTIAEDYEEPEEEPEEDPIAPEPVINETVSENEESIAEGAQPPEILTEEEMQLAKRAYADGNIIDEHTSKYVSQASIRYVISPCSSEGDSVENDEDNIVSYTYFKCGRIVPYDIDVFIDTVDETEFFYMLVESENGNQSSLARRLTADCLLNQMASPKYPDTIKECILNPGVYEVVSKGSIFNTHPKESTKQCVDTELISQIDYSVMYFRTQHYHTFGVPYEHVGDCWFSKPAQDDSTQWLSEEQQEEIKEANK